MSQLTLFHYLVSLGKQPSVLVGLNGDLNKDDLILVMIVGGDEIQRTKADVC